MLIGSTTSHFAQFEDIFNNERVTLGNVGGGSELKVDGEEGQNKQAIKERSVSNAGPDDGPQSLSSINLAVQPGKKYLLNPYSTLIILSEEQSYPKQLDMLAQYTNEPEFPMQFKLFLYSHQHPNHLILDDIETYVKFTGKINVFHSTITHFYVIFAVLEECIASTSSLLHHGLAILIMTLYLLFRMRIGTAWRICWLHKFIFCFHLLMKIPMMEKWCPVHWW